jgi:hypothetical protein
MELEKFIPICLLLSLLVGMIALIFFLVFDMLFLARTLSVCALIPLAIGVVIIMIEVIRIK